MPVFECLLQILYFFLLVLLLVEEVSGIVSILVATFGHFSDGLQRIEVVLVPPARLRLSWVRTECRAVATGPLRLSVLLLICGRNVPFTIGVLLQHNIWRVLGCLHLRELPSLRLIHVGVGTTFFRGAHA